MGTLLHSETRRLYSWWWDSHISPKNSKWLQENLTEIDAKVKAMIKIINEDADSFARRADMYYKKRPELMKLVEEFYRAYRALAERYDHATGELRLAHKTMSEVFPNQVPPFLSDDTPSSSEPTSPINPHLVRAFFESDDRCKDSDVGLSRKGLKQLNEMFQTGEAVLRELKSAEEKLMGNLPGVEIKHSNSAQGLYLLSDDNQNPNTAGEAEAEMQNLKEALAKMEAERDAVLFQYRESLEKLTDLEKELNSVQNDAEELGKHANEAQDEVKMLKESLAELETERDASLNQYRESSQKVASLEATMAAAQEETTKWSDRAVEAEAECQNLKKEISILETNKQEALVRYEQSMEKISSLEEKLLLVEENAKRLNEQIGLAEDEIKALKHKLSGLDEEKEEAYLRYHQCLDTISKLQNELMEAKEDIGRLNAELLSGSAKLRAAEDQCALIEKMNEYLKLEADDLIQQIAEKDQQLFQKHDDLEKLMSCLEDEESRFEQVEATLSSLQNLHVQSQEEQRSLALELKNGLQMLKDLELCKRDLELEMQHIREENRGLNDLKLASCIAERDMEHEISGLKEIKDKLEAEVRRRAEQNDALQRQVQQLKEEIEDLHRKYRGLLQEVESAGIDPKCVGSSIEDLRNEYTRLKEVSAEEKEEKEALLKKLEDMEGLLERSAILESSLSEMNIELERSKEKTKALQESCDSLSAEKLTLVAEKSALLSQLQMITETIQGLLEKNASLESLLSCANVELEGLRVKSKSLEDVCQLLSNEKSNLQSERSSPISQLQLVEKNVESIEMRFVKLEDKYAGLEKEEESTRSQVEELRTSFGAEKQERARLLMTSEARFSGLDDRIDILQEESKCRKEEFEEQLEKAVNAQVEIFILHKFIQDMEEKNYTLIAECQKHAETAKHSEKVISELEGENMMQHLEMEFLLDRVDKLRRGIFQVMKALEIDHVNEAEPEVFLPCIGGTIKGIRRDLVEGRDENQQLLIQNTVLSTVIRQLSSEGSELAMQKEVLDHEFGVLEQKHVALEHEKDQLLERNGLLDAVVDVKEREQEIAEAQMEAMSLKQESLQRECAALQESHSDALEANRCLQGKLSEVEEENHSLVEENSAAIVEALRFSNESAIFQSSWVQKALELEGISEELNHLREAYYDSENDARALRDRLAVKEVENLQLGELIQKLEEKNEQLSVFNDQLNHRFLVKGEQLNQKEMELFGAEQRIKALQDANNELHTTVEGLEMHSEGLDVIRGSLERRISELTEYKEHQEKEIVSLREANNSLESDIDLLNQEMEACKIREVILSSELHERSCEFELWEAEASSFYFDLQTSAVREAVYEDKVHELSGLCDDLEDVTIRSSIERETMTDKISFLEGENQGLKSQLAAYLPAIASLKNNIVSLEQNPLLQTRFRSPGTPQRQQVQEFTVCDASSSAPDGLSELQDLQSRIETIEAAVEYKIAHRAESKPYGTPEHGNGAHMKDIQLDYVPDAPSSSNDRRGDSDKLDPMLELWETAEQDTGMGFGEIEKELGVDMLEVSNNGGGTKIIIERLASDAQKLESLNVSVQELKRKMEISKRRTSSKAFEYERLRGQLQEMDDSVAQLANVNTELTKAIDESPRSSSDIIDAEQAQKRNVSEQATKEGEKIERLQLDVQKIQYIVLKLEDEKNENSKGKSRFMRSRTGIVLKEFFVFGRGRRGGKPKPRFCGCLRPYSHKQV